MHRLNLEQHINRGEYHVLVKSQLCDVLVTAQAVGGTYKTVSNDEPCARLSRVHLVCGAAERELAETLAVQSREARSHHGQVSPCGDDLLAANRAQEIAAQLKFYLEGETQDLPRLTDDELSYKTPFAREVWQALINIPYGHVATYGEIAKAIGNPRAYRAVAQAARANELLLVVPCHRLVAADGIGGFWPGADLKRALMKHEGIDWR